MNVIMHASLCGALALACLWLGACSKAGETKTRAAQEKQFRSSFGFPPPATVTEIKHKDSYQRGIVDGTYDQWMRLTFQQDVFDQMQKDNHFKLAVPSFILADRAATPEWWPQDGAGKNPMYVREGKDGYSFNESLWHDAKTGFVYWHQTCWD